MGSYSSLCFTNSMLPPEPGALNDSTEPYLESKYHLPLLWLALYEPAEVTILPPDENGESWPYLVKRRSDALQLLTAREAWLTSNFPALKHVWLEQFQRMLGRVSAEYVHFDTSDIGGMMGSSEEWQKNLLSFLHIFSVPQQVPDTGILGRLLKQQNLSEPWRIFQKMLGSAFSGEQAHEPWAYCGGSAFEEEMEWER